MVDSISLMSSLETTRNPFESGFEERTNYPGFSPSMFAKQDTPASQKKRRSFRWSIEQISRLNPAEIDEFPNQEYSSTFEREEDEIETQKAIDEYFSQNAIVPSPWTPNHSMKHVKFSPLPPTTAYIVAESSVESSYCSPNSSMGKADAGSQTKLSLPPGFDLQIHLDPAYYNQEEQECSRDFSMSSLRRKLFSHEEKRMQTDKGFLGLPSNIKSILKSPRSPALVTSSPVSSKAIPEHNTHRHSSSSTISSPNISPIKPLTTSDRLTPTGRPRLCRQTLSPMDFSVNVLESSGIENGGAVFPDISPIKGDEGNGNSSQEEHIEEMDVDLASGDRKDLQNSSVDDGGPLEVSALSAQDEVVNEKRDEDDNSDDKMPPKITLEDLADESVLTTERRREPSSANRKLVQQRSRESQSPDNCITEAMGIGEAGVKETDIPSKYVSKESSLKIEEIEPSLSHDRVTEGGPLKLVGGISGHYNGISDPGRTYRAQKSFPKWSHLCEIDEDIILMRAKAALRRANKYSPPGDSGISFGPHSLAELNLNSSSQHWEPVGMSTPLLPLLSASGRSVRPVGHSSHYGYKSGNSSKPWPGRYDSAALNFDEESGLGRSGGGEPVSDYPHNISWRKPSLLMEDLMKRRRHCSYEGHLPYSPLWKKLGSPLMSSRHQTKWQLSRTYPMTYLEWKSLYWRPSLDREPWNNEMSFVDMSSHQSEFKRSSWPPSRPFLSKLFYGSRPLSPPVSFPPAKIPRAVPGGSVSKIALPSLYNSSDSGYSDWHRSVSRWESAIRKQHSLTETDGLRYHY